VAVSTRTVGHAFASIVGDHAVRPGEDGGLVDGVVPRWVVAPGSVAELSRVVALAHDERLAIVPRGSGNALALGHPIRRADVVVDLGRMAEVIEYNPDDLTATVQAGALLEGLAALLRPRAQCLPLDPPGGARRTLGGLVATGASGPLRLRYGTMRDLLLGVRFVQADGIVTWGGAKVVKSVTGYDVPKLMVGALGTLGVLAELTLRLHPAPACERTSLAAFASADAAQVFVAAVVDSPLQPSRVEWLNALASQPWGVTDAAASVAISIGSVEEAVRTQEARIAELARGAGGAWRPVDEPMWWHHGQAGEIAPSRPDAISLRVASLASHLAETVQGIEDSVGRMAPSAAVAVSGCAPLGVLRAHILGADARQGAALVARLREVVAPVGGTVVVERAPGALREVIDPWGPVAPDAFALMRAVKRQFDPDGILNPGRFVGGL
jgi:glycolate oxidase FAD binding subunit